MINWLKGNKKISLSMVFVIITLTFFIILGKSFALVETEKVELTGNTVNLEKKAKWLDNGSAEVTIKAKSIKQEKDQKEYQDVVFIIDTSKEINKASINEAINEVLSKNGNKVALITYNDLSTSSGFSEDKNSLTNNIDSLIIGGNRNVYKAYRSLDELLSDYEQKEDRDLKVILSVNGEANIDTPNEKVIYQVLKQKYKYLTIDAIQNNLGLKEVKSIQDITDTILIPKINTNPYTELLKINQYKYNTLQIDDEINSDYYEIKEVVSTTGLVTIDNNKINWNLDNYYSGFEETLTIRVNLKNEYRAKTGLYKISNKLILTEELENSGKTQKEIIDSPVLKVGKHTVTYDGNAPKGCTVENVPMVKSYAMFTNVDIEKIVPTCQGYNFKGWKIVDESVVKNSQDNFVVSGKDIVIKATWGQAKTKIEADGKIYTGPTKLKSWEKDSTVDFHTSAYRDNIISVDFVNYRDLSKAINLTNGTGGNYWDISFDNSEKVIGWLELDNEDQTKYHLYIGTDGKTLYANEDSSYLFYNFTALKKANFVNFNTKYVTNMGAIFGECSSLIELDVSNFNTSSVKDMRYMFTGCKTLTNLDLSSFDTTNVINMNGMFRDCSSITSLNLSNFNTSEVKNMDYMFMSCKTLTSLDLDNFNTSNVTTMIEMFHNCSSLTSLDLGSFDTVSVTEMSYMFIGCSSLTSLDLSNFDTNKVTTMNSMFYECSSLTSLDISNFDTSSVTDMGNMFRNCISLTSLDISNFDTSNVTDMSWMFNGCIVLPSLDVSGFDTSKVTYMSGMFSSLSLTSLDVSNFDTSNVTDMSSMFVNCGRLTSLDLSDFDTSNVIDMRQMFSGCRSLTSLDLSSLDTSNVTDMSRMFHDCRSLTSLDVSNFDTSNVTDMMYMFYNCSGLTNLDLSSFDTSKVIDMICMFRDCSRLTGLDLSNFDTSNVTDMSYMFNGCSSLTSLDLSSFDTSKVTGMYYMFNGCSSLTNLDLSNFNTSSVTWMRNMFSECSSLTSIDLSSFDMSKVTNKVSMLSGTNKVTTAYARTEADAAILNDGTSKPDTYTFIVKP